MEYILISPYVMSVFQVQRSVEALLQFKLPGIQQFGSGNYLQKRW